ncbi:hypothetical protein DESC_290082 [Desulfosarcina cetonica]|uniref:class I SAM-dependent methyltransferase n=1 Tax=Desulfosarcina cetonica TaxID=90730 RepID=UPI0006D125B4|nr:methyltransferase domain-containing protein [Desulfosarcina cetonica]VTR65012.1 hypothetical protein DESC_290082 [Desulfosarcina cetonica]
MSHTEQIDFCRRVRERFAKYFERVFVLDAGSLDINGNNQYLFKDALYLGVDIGCGKNVDVVQKIHELRLPDNTFDTIISTEVFEHDMFYAESIENIYRMLKAGGMFLFTCATEGRPEHGTERNRPQDAPLLQGHYEWSQYYKNLTEEDIWKVINVEEKFSQYKFEKNTSNHDLYFWGIKNGVYEANENYSILMKNSISRVAKDAEIKEIIKVSHRRAHIIESLEAHLKSKEKMMCETEDQFMRERETWAFTESDLKKKISSLQVEREQQKGMIAALENSLEKIRSEQQHQYGILFERERAIEVLSIERDKQFQQVIQQKDKIDDLQTQIDGYKQTIHEHQQRLQNATSELDSIKLDIDAFLSLDYLTKRKQ